MRYLLGSLLASAVTVLVAAPLGLGQSKPEAFVPRAVDAAIYKRIEQCRNIAARIKIDGKAGDWDGIPEFGDSQVDTTGEAPRDITRVSIAPREDELLILIRTTSKPSQEDLSFWFSVDCLAGQPDDYQIGLSKTGLHTLWVWEEGKLGTQGQIRGIEFAIGDVVEVRVPYRALAAGLPKPMANQLTGDKARPFVRVSPFTWNHQNKQAIDYGPAVGCFRLLAKPFPLDAPPPRNAKGVKAIDLPVRGKWYVGQGAYGGWTHQDVFAYDLYMVDHTGHPSVVRDSPRNEDYLSWGQQVLAPVAGRVMRARREIPDQPPKTGTFTKPSDPKVNEVYLDMGDGLGLSFLHFKRNTVSVTQGTTVQAGKVLGQVGSSGASGWPHLHFGLWRLPEGRVSVPLALSNVRVGLNHADEDPWTREFPTWDIREGYFVERITR